LGVGVPGGRVDLTVFPQTPRWVADGVVRRAERTPAAGPPRPIGGRPCCARRPAVGSTRPAPLAGIPWFRRFVAGRERTRQSAVVRRVRHPRAGASGVGRFGRLQATAGSGWD